MRRAIRIAQMCVRATGTILLLLGIVIWTGHGAQLVPAHAALGVAFVLSLWVVAVIGLRSGIGAVLPARLLVWALIIGWFGIAQRRVVVGDLHWIIQVLHLAVGLIGMGLSEAVGARVRKGAAPAAAGVGPAL